jgi:PrcB C-terminal
MGRHVLFAAALSSAFYFQCADAHPSIPVEVKWQSTFGPAAPTYVAIKSNEQWLRFWESMRIDQERFVHSPTPSFDKAPEIDFSRYTLIVVGTGTKPSGGFGISIQNVVQKSNHSIRVSVLEKTPGHNCAGSAVSISPFVVASIPATGKEVIFDVISAETAC